MPKYFKKSTLLPWGALIILARTLPKKNTSIATFFKSFILKNYTLTNFMHVLDLIEIDETIYKWAQINHKETPHEQNKHIQE